MRAVTDNVACDLRSLALFRLILAAAVAFSGIPIDTPLAILVLVPTCLWSWLTDIFNFSVRSRLRIYFDRDCGFCRKTWTLFRTFFLLGNAPIVPAQSDEDAYRILQREVGWVVCDYNGQVFLRWHAVLLLLRRAPVFWPLGRLLTALGMGYWGDPIYRAIGASRGWLSKLTAVVLPYRREVTPAGRPASLLIGSWLFASLLVTSLPPHAR